MDFNITPKEEDLIRRIVGRMIRMKRVQNPDHAGFLRMDLIAAHKNGCALKLHDLLNAPDKLFLHDVEGLHTHIDRETGRLVGGFRPHYAEKPLIALPKNRPVKDGVW